MLDGVTITGYILSIIGEDMNLFVITFSEILIDLILFCLSTVTNDSTSAGNTSSSPA